MVLAVVFVALAGAEVQLGPAVGAVEKPGEHAGFARLGRPALVFRQLLYPFPLDFFDDGGLGALLDFLISL